MKKHIIIAGSIISVAVLIIVLTFSVFPRKFSSDIKKYTSIYGLPTSYIASVICIESGYDTQAVSQAGAMGLMQLMPSTAFDCADRLDIQIEQEQLFDKDVSLNLGCFYLRYLLDLFDGDWINTLCAYNWGYGNVCNWLALGNVDKNGTITKIPVEETKEYIKKFKICQFVYEKVYRY